MYLGEVMVPTPLPRRCAVSIVQSRSIQQMGTPVFNVNSPYLDISAAGADLLRSDEAPS